MPVLILNYRNAWNDYFSATNPTLLSSQTHTSKPTLSGAGVYISDCLFRTITSSDTGGALYSSNSVTYLLIESTSFFSCRTSNGHAGAVYFYHSSGGECVLHEVCGYDCFSAYPSGTPHYLFAYLRANAAASYKNYFNYSSIVHCVNPDTYYTICLSYGKICCPSVNMSMNKCNIRTIYCIPFAVSNSVTCSFSHSSFADNIVTGFTCFFLNRGGTDYEIKSCNILRNTQDNLGTEGTIYTVGNLDIKDSCILENKANRIFHQGSSSCTVTLSNCTVDLTSNNGYLTIKNTVTKSFIHALNHMSTQNCDTDYDSAGYITPIIQTPSSSKKRIHCYTFGNFFYYSQLRIFISLLGVFHFNFINPYAPSDLWY
jgi:hypothetical protein